MLRREEVKARIRRDVLSACTHALIACLVAITLSVAPALAESSSRSGPGQKPSWRCIAGVCLGHTRAAIAYRFGGIVDEVPSRGFRVRGGHVSVCFYRCFGAVSEDHFTAHGGTVRPGNRVFTLYTCDPIFELPDGTAWGTRIPFGQRWNGYRRTVLYEPGPRPGWAKTVSKAKTRVVLDISQGSVSCVSLEQTPR